MKARFGTILVAALMVAATAAGAQAPNAGSRQRSLRLYQEAETDYRAGRFADAADKLEQAYDLFAEPILLYNLGRALEGMGELDDARTAYREFLDAADDDAEERPATEARLVAIDSLLAELADRTPVRTTEPEAHSESDEPVVIDIVRPAPNYTAPIILGSSALALGAAGLALQLRAQAAHTDAGAPETTQEDADRLNGQATRRAAFGIAALSLAGALAAGAVVSLVLGKKRRAHVSAGAGSLELRLQF